MKKIAVLLAVVLATAATVVTGTRVEPALQEAVTRYAARNPGMTLDLKYAGKGLFSSRYVYACRYPLPDTNMPGATKLFTADVVFDVTNGPFPVAVGVFTPCLALVDSSFTLGEDTDQDILSFFRSLPELGETKARTRLGFDGGSVTNVTVPAFQRTLQDSSGMVEVSFKGLTGELSAGPGGDSLKGTLRSPGASLQGPKGFLVLDAPTLDMDAKALKENFWTGRYSLRGAGLSLSSANSGSFRVKDMLAEASLIPRGQVLDYSVRLSGGYQNQDSPVMPAQVGFSLRDLDIAALERFVLLIQKMQAPETSLAQDAELRAIGEGLLRASPSLVLEASAFEGDSRLHSRCEIKTEGMTTLPGSPDQALSRLRARAEFQGKDRSVAELVCSFSEAARKPNERERCLAEIAGAVNELAAQGLVLREGDRLRSQAVWDGRSLLVNGKPLR